VCVLDFDFDEEVGVVTTFKVVGTEVKTIGVDVDLLKTLCDLKGSCADDAVGDDELGV
jgi:hypothetical protein